MKVLLVDIQTGLYVTGNGGWTSEAVEARDFETAPKAAEYAFQQKLIEVEVLFSFPDAKKNASIPLGQMSRPSPGFHGRQFL